MLQIRVIQVDTNEKAFTLIEVMVSIALISIILFTLFNLNLVSWKFYNLNDDNIQLSQAASVIAVGLDKNIRSAVAHNIKSGEYSELILNTGEKNSDQKNDFLKYIVEDNKLLLKRPENDGFELNDDKLPKAINWRTDRVLSSKIVVQNFEIETDSGRIKYSMELEKGKSNFKLVNKIRPRR